ncbi:MAG: class I SAM-dependent methyltransferase [Anaeromyxobacteraceae bacterium]
MNKAGLPPNVLVVSELPAGHSGYSLEDRAVVEALWKAEERHFWHRARNRFIQQGLRRLGAPPPATFLEIGCGGGCVAAALSRSGYRVTGVDGHAELVLRAAARAPGASFVVHDLGRGLDDVGGREWDAAGLFDVLEHLEDPAEAVADAARRVVPGGLVVGTVPALMSLWSDVDARSGHRLRFEPTGLREVLRGMAGTEVLEVRPFNRLLVPMLWMQRRAAGRRDALERGLAVPWAPVNWAMDGLLRAEYVGGAALDRMGMPGASLWFAVRVR